MHDAELDNVATLFILGPSSRVVDPHARCIGARRLNVSEVSVMRLHWPARAHGGDGFSDGVARGASLDGCHVNLRKRNLRTRVEKLRAAG